MQECALVRCEIATRESIHVLSDSFLPSEELECLKFAIIMAINLIKQTSKRIG